MRRLLRGLSLPPMHLGNFMGMIVIFFAFFLESAVGAYLDGLSGKIIGIIALASVVLYVIGWARKQYNVFMLAIALSASVWLAVFTVLIIEGGAWVSAMVSLSWFVSAGGAWIVERRINK